MLHDGYAAVPGFGAGSPVWADDDSPEGQAGQGTGLAVDGSSRKSQQVGKRFHLFITAAVETSRLRTPRLLQRFFPPRTLVRDKWSCQSCSGSC